MVEGYWKGRHGRACARVRPRRKPSTTLHPPHFLTTKVRNGGLLGIKLVPNFTTARTPTYLGRFRRRDFFCAPFFFFRTFCRRFGSLADAGVDESVGTTEISSSASSTGSPVPGRSEGRATGRSGRPENGVGSLKSGGVCDKTQSAGDGAASVGTGCASVGKDWSGPGIG